MVDMTFLAEGFFGSLISAFENAQWRKVKQIKLNINNQVSFVVHSTFLSDKIGYSYSTKGENHPCVPEMPQFQNSKGFIELKSTIFIIPAAIWAIPMKNESSQ